MSPVTLAVEDVVSEVVGRRLVEALNEDLYVDQVLGKRGFGYLKNRAPSFNKAAQSGVIIILIADLDLKSCPVSVIDEWLGEKPCDYFVFRIAVREIETWLLADGEGFADYFCVPQGRIPVNVEDIFDPKQELVNLVRRSRKRSIRDSIVPRDPRSARVAPAYNSTITDFVRNVWSIDNARARSQSLRRACEAIRSV